jgi:hypothetical protein
MLDHMFCVMEEMSGNARVSTEQLCLSTRSKQKSPHKMDNAGARIYLLIKFKSTPEFTHRFLKCMSGNIG